MLKNDFFYVLKRKKSKCFIWTFKDNLHVLICLYDNNRFHFYFEADLIHSVMGPKYKAISLN